MKCIAFLNLMVTLALSLQISCSKKKSSDTNKKIPSLESLEKELNDTGYYFSQTDSTSVYYCHEKFYQSSLTFLKNSLPLIKTKTANPDLTAKVKKLVKDLENSESKTSSCKEFIQDHETPLADVSYNIDFSKVLNALGNNSLLSSLEKNTELSAYGELNKDSLYLEKMRQSLNSLISGKNPNINDLIFLITAKQLFQSQKIAPREVEINNILTNFSTLVQRTQVNRGKENLLTPGELKLAFEQQLMSKLQVQEIFYNKEKSNILNMVNEGQMQCLSGTNVQLLVNFLGRQEHFFAWHPVVIIQPGHVLLGFVVNNKLFGVETTVNGLGEFELGEIKKINQVSSQNMINSFYLLPAYDYLALFALGHAFDPSLKEKLLKQAAGKIDQLFGTKNLTAMNSLSMATNRKVEDFMFLPWKHNIPVGNLSRHDHPVTSTTIKGLNNNLAVSKKQLAIANNLPQVFINTELRSLMNESNLYFESQAPNPDEDGHSLSFPEFQKNELTSTCYLAQKNICLTLTELTSTHDSYSLKRQHFIRYCEKNNGTIGKIINGYKIFHDQESTQVEMNELSCINQQKIFYDCTAHFYNDDNSGYDSAYERVFFYAPQTPESLINFFKTMGLPASQPTLRKDLNHVQKIIPRCTKWRH